MGRAEDIAPSVSYLHGDRRFDFELESHLNARDVRIKRNLLAETLEVHHQGQREPFTDDWLAEIRFSFIFASNGKEPSKDKLVDALLLIGKRQEYHPVHDYLYDLKWDGEPRIDKWLVDFAGAADTSFNRAVGRKILAAAVRRTRLPGCKFDQVPVLIGQQGVRKSTLIRSLCPSDEWFSDQVKVGADARETMERACGAWIVELAELDGMSKREAQSTKSFITTTHDKARPAYGRNTVERGRQFVLFGTTNEATFLTDLTGNRRWWPVEVQGCDPDGVASIRDQLWAEAVAIERDEPLWLDTPELQQEAEAATGAAQDHGAWYDLLESQITFEGPAKISAVDAWGMVGITPEKISTLSNMHRTLMGRALHGLGFDPESRVLRRDGKSVRAYVRGGADAEWWSPVDDQDQRPGLYGDPSEW